MGDFNTFLRSSEKEGYIGINIEPRDDFLQCCVTAGLEDLRATGCLHTWSNNQGIESWMRIKLDRVLINDRWNTMFGRSEAHFLEATISDHSAMTVHLNSDVLRINSPFRFLNCWVAHNNFLEVVRAAWRLPVDGCLMFQVFQRLKNVKFALRRLHVQHFSNLGDRIDIARAAVMEAQAAMRMNMQPNSKVVLAELTSQLRTLLRAEDNMVQQQCKDDWFKLYDRNTKYFYSILRSRAHRNYIPRLMRDDGTWAVTKEEIGDEVIHFYKGLLGTRIDSWGRFDDDSFGAGPVLNDNQRNALIADFTEDEVKEALWGIGDNKAPGIDGFNSLFFKKTWDITGSAITEAVLMFFRNGKLLRQANSTIIHLIPKGDNASRVCDFRPIACCTIIFKIISRMICKRLRWLLPHVIDPSQSAFVAGRSIVDNVLLCQELMRGYDQKHVTPRCLIKIDLRKAYDSVRWGFIEVLLQKFGFPQRFSDWVMTCITSTTFTFSINGELSGFLVGQRGLRQGDPLSPYVFVLVMEYFTRCLKGLGRVADFRYHPKCKKLGIVSLSFADDLMIFARADTNSLLQIKSRLLHFGVLSGLEANSGKSAVYFGVGLIWRIEGRRRIPSGSRSAMDHFDTWVFP
ncbi:hypothetical protein Dimus_038167 [Dionaea muscipula]